MSKKENIKPKTEETVNQQSEMPKAAEPAAEEPQEESAVESSETDKLQELGEKLADLNDKYLRLYSEYENYRKGVQLIYNKFMKILVQTGFKAIESKGEKFDEAMHEAVTQIPAPTPDQKGLVVDVVEKGYYLNDKVLRYAKVVVAC